LGARNNRKVLTGDEIIVGEVESSSDDEESAISSSKKHKKSDKAQKEEENQVESVDKHLNHNPLLVKAVNKLNQPTITVNKTQNLTKSTISQFIVKKKSSDVKEEPKVAIETLKSKKTVMPAPSLSGLLASYDDDDDDSSDDE
jgi:hypothetical protein